MTSSTAETLTITRARIQKVGGNPLYHGSLTNTLNNVQFSGNQVRELALADPSSYATGTIETYEWDMKWSLRIETTVELLYSDYYEDPLDPTIQGGDNYRIASLTGSVTFKGTWKVCTRSLYVQPPVCFIQLRGAPSNRHTSHSWYTPNTAPAHYKDSTTSDGETFDPDGSGPESPQVIRVFSVGPNRRSEIGLHNFENPFSLKMNTPTFSYSRADPFNSGRDPTAAHGSDQGSSSQKILESHMMGAIYPNHVSYVHEPTTNIDFPGALSGDLETQMENLHRQRRLAR